MNKKITIPAILLAAVTATGIMIPQNAMAHERRVDDRDKPPKFSHYDRERHHYRHKRKHDRHHQHRPRHAPRWYRHYQRHHAYGHHYRPWRGHPGFYGYRHGWKKHYRRMERKHHHHPRHDRRHHDRHYDSNIHFRIDYWN